MSPKDKIASRLECLHCRKICAIGGKIDRIRNHLKKCMNFYKWLKENVDEHDWPHDYRGVLDKNGTKIAKLDQQDLREGKYSSCCACNDLTKIRIRDKT